MTTRSRTALVSAACATAALAAAAVLAAPGAAPLASEHATEHATIEIDGGPVAIHGPPARTPRFALLAGPEEVPGPGDPDGRGSITVLLPGPRTVCYAIAVTGIDRPIAAHIHRGVQGRAGDVVVALPQVPARGTGTASACVSASRAIVSQIRRRPGNFYVNVHTRRYPDGAIRGNLFVVVS